ncbi:hypothetical protein FOPG_06734 [Fusarium oxysporum f. sp. conglutinans race 2 54008]|uniref:DUF8004 domain-containing protein n=3 Tax=Fusarium oxysporum f. sp. conglutinans TaxID=100902 RepID=A0A8H6GZF0_FUSOX|nr:hypothetical protein FOXB_01862 [Fusarium oxysporum f. sp. conglutinans Fo5176]EXL79196.1 hypothetical protein FOPG_06734 [Fusarium oxysporum f. sp. conglutinans race 2 54008]KAF6526290.1 hypothetical protein HZS61_009334 [Fusarium oxysporum f. sp. conglutinans]KAG6981032.1 hypothetical protein FocnCong_v009106 [Fusarium oxysporum f. sp. conglutinans]KAI8414539.1 hypothetical protein FOFC_04151 [Fusarium oxysporum]
MSARSAYARKKTTQAKNKDPVIHGRAQSVATSSSGEELFTDHSIPPNIPTPIAARFPQIQQNASMPMGNRGDWTPRGRPMMAPDWNRDAYTSNQYAEEWVHNKPRRATLPDEYGTIERSGLRTMLDKRSDDVRKTIAKTFTFRKKEKEEEPIDQDSNGSRPSVETLQPTVMPSPSPNESSGWDSQSVARTDTTLTSTSSYAASQNQMPLTPTSQLSFGLPPVGPPPTSKLPPIPQVPSAPPPQIRRWCGGGRPITKWNKLRKDPELWDPNGDVLIYLGKKGQSLPSLRVSSHIIEAINSRYLISLLDEGLIDGYLHSPPSPNTESYGRKLGQEFRNSPLTPPASGRTSIGDMGGQVLYEMHFPPPQNMKSIDQLRHQLTTRNFFALLLNASMVGLSLHEALSDLHVRLDSYMPPNNDNVGQLVRYLYNRDLDDVRNNPALAVSLLIWSEEPDVRWEEGWRECFTHCVGMFDLVQKYKDFKQINTNTRKLMEMASHEMQYRVQAAEERLAGFRYQDIWAFTPKTGSEMRAIERLKDMLLQHFEQEYGSWPPSQSDSRSGRSVGSSRPETWLTRTLAMKLQRDFGELYDCMVDRDIVWGSLEIQFGSRLMMVSKSKRRAIDADTREMHLTDMLIDFDNKHRFPHIPHPFPLLPESTSAAGSFRRGIAKTRGDQMSALEERIRLAYTENTGFDEPEIKLSDAFERFEKTDDIGDMDPATARRSRWILIYGILQSLASVSVDDEKVQYNDKVDYHLCPRLEGAKIPPWKRGTSEGIGQGAHERSYCWVAEAERVIESDEYGDDVDMSLINDFPIQLNSPGAAEDRNTASGGSLGTGFISPRVRERMRRNRENESPVTADYGYTYT